MSIFMSNSVNRHVNIIESKIVVKCQNSNVIFRVIFKQCEKQNNTVFRAHFKIYLLLFSC